VSYFTGKLATEFTTLTHIKASIAIYAAQSYDAANAIIKALVADKTTSSIEHPAQGDRGVSCTSVLHGRHGSDSFQADGNLKDDKGAVAISKSRTEDHLRTSVG
jgi:hypothetical protein